MFRSQYSEPSAVEGGALFDFSGAHDENGNKEEGGAQSAMGGAE
jgi:hypothetical protein